MKTIRFAFVLISAALYVLSVSRPAMMFHLKPPYNPLQNRLHIHTGTQMLTLSIFGPLQMNFAGLANPLLWASWLFLLFGNLRNTFACAFSAALISLQTFQLILIPIPLDESGNNYETLLRPM